MSSEERWIRIENALQTVVERQALNDAQIAKNDIQIAQNAAAICELSTHSRQTDERFQILAENMVVLVHKVDGLSDTVRSHGEMMTELGRKIDILVETVDRIIRAGR